MLSKALGANSHVVFFIQYKLRIYVLKLCASQEWNYLRSFGITFPSPGPCTDITGECVGRSCWSVNVLEPGKQQVRATVVTLDSLDIGTSWLPSSGCYSLVTCNPKRYQCHLMINPLDLSYTIFMRASEDRPVQYNVGKWYVSALGSEKWSQCSHHYSLHSF